MRLLGLTSYRRRVAYAVGRCTRVTQSRLAGLWCVGAESRLVLVNTMIRLPGAFTSMAVRPPGKYPREAKSGLHILHEDMYNLLNESK